MTERELRGSPASPGVAIGSAWLRAEGARNGTEVPAEDLDRECERARQALAVAAQALRDVAAGLPSEEAEMIEAGALMALDPALGDAVRGAIVSEHIGAAAAILRATDEHADAIAALGDELLAARAGDVRSMGRRAARLAAGGEADEPPGEELILVTHDLGPADVAELATVLAGVALVGGGSTAHAAIVARSLGIPMVTGVEDGLLEVADGAELALDGTTGGVIVEPSAQWARATRELMLARRLADRRAADEHDRPALTIDRKKITVLANVASAAELELALRAGAEGIGLVRTELAFLDATEWPAEQAHAAALVPILAGLGPRRAVVRVLDFGGDKAPPFLDGIPERGLELLLAHPDALMRQLRAIVLCSRGRRVDVLLPMVNSPGEVIAARAALERAARQLEIEPAPALGSMIETPAAAESAAAIAQISDFLSIGTNDLTASTLGADRFAANDARAHHPRVLGLINRAVEDAHEAGIAIEVCGEAASDPLMLPLLVGLGVDELSVGAAQVGAVRRWIRQLDAGDAGRLARSALAMETAEDVERALRGHQLLEIEDGAAQVGLRLR